MPRRALMIFAALLLLAGCSGGPPASRAPADLQAAAGPDFVQLAWTHGAADATYVFESREAGSDSAGWEETVPERIDAESRSALLPLPEAGVVRQYRAGILTAGEPLFSTPSPELSRPDGITLQAGPLNRGSWSPLAGTAFALWFHLPEGAASPFDVTVEAPDGSTVIAGEGHVQPETGFLAWGLYGRDFASGTYTATVTDAQGNSWTHAPAVEDTHFRLAQPHAPQLERTADGRLRAAWRQPVSGAWALAGLEGTEYVPAMDSAAFFSDPATDGSLQLEVTASNIVPPPPGGPVIMPLPFGMSTEAWTVNVR